MIIVCECVVLGTTHLNYETVVSNEPPLFCSSPFHISLTETNALLITVPQQFLPTEHIATDDGQKAALFPAAASFLVGEQGRPEGKMAPKLCLVPSAFTYLC